MKEDRDCIFRTQKTFVQPHVEGFMLPLTLIGWVFTVLSFLFFLRSFLFQSDLKYWSRIFFQADVYAVESLFVCNVRTFIMFCSEHVVYKCVYLECSDVAHVYPYS